MDYESIIEAIQPSTPWMTGYPLIAERIRSYLDSNPTLTLSTNEMCEALLPLREVRGPGITARARLLAKLGNGAIAEHAAKGYATKSTLLKVTCGRPGYGWIWSAPGNAQREASMTSNTKPRIEVERPVAAPAPLKPPKYTVMRLTERTSGRKVLVRMTFSVITQAMERGSRLSFSWGKELEVLEHISIIEDFLMTLGSLEVEEVLNPEDI